MSSYIISAKQFNTIEKNLIDLSNDRKIYFTPSQINNIMQSMREINVTSVCDQYRGAFNKMVELYNVEKTTTVKKISLVELYKLMRCLDYQIETIEESKEDHYNEFHKIIEVIANKIIINLPDYDRASWSID